MADRNTKQAESVFRRYALVCPIDARMYAVDLYFMGNWNGGKCLSAILRLVRRKLDDEEICRAGSRGSLGWVTSCDTTYVFTKVRSLQLYARLGCRALVEALASQPC